MAETRTLLDKFLAANPHPELTDALTSFLASPLPTRHGTAWVPPAEEAATRLDLARQLRQNIIAAMPKGFDAFTFTAVQLSPLLLMPLDGLRALVEATGHGVSRNERSNRAQAFLASIDSLGDNVRYFLQGHHPDAARKKRKTPGQDPQPIEGPCGTSPVHGRDFVSRSEQEGSKCLARDQDMCVFTHSMHPQVCHIVPFAFSSTATNLGTYSRRFANAMIMLFFPLQDDEASPVDLIANGLGCSDASWNMLSVTPYLHAWWARPYWAVQCVGIESADGGHAVVLSFHWMPHQKGGRQPNQVIRLASDFQDMMDALDRGRSYGEGRGPNMQGFSNGIQHDSFRPIVSGQEFRVVHDTLEDAKKMRKMVDIQWACVRLAAISGAAGPDDDDDDFSEFDFDREQYERAVFLGYVDDVDDTDANKED